MHYFFKCGTNEMNNSEVIVQLTLKWFPSWYNSLIGMIFINKKAAWICTKKCTNRLPIKCTYCNSTWQVTKESHKNNEKTKKKFICKWLNDD